MRTYAIGDIHGQRNRLRAAHALIATDQARHGPGTVVHLGDLVDRGPDARGVIDDLMAGLAAGQDWVVLKGNHDRMFSGFLATPDWQDPGLRGELSWLHPRLGGAATLASYGVRSAADRPPPHVWEDAASAVPDSHRRFLQGLPVMWRAEGVVFVHAGIRPGVAIEQQVEDDLTWIREPFLSDRRDHGALIVHGHTVTPEPMHHGNRVNIDTGAGYGHALTAIVIEGPHVYHLTPRGRMQLYPGG